MRKRRRPCKLSVEIVGKEHDMNYKKVMRYIRLNSLVPEPDKVDTKQIGALCPWWRSRISSETSGWIAVSIDGEQSSPRWPRRSGSTSWTRRASSTAM